MPIYVSNDFLEELVHTTPIDFLNFDNIDVNKGKIELIQFLLNNAIIYIDKTLEEAKELLGK